MIFSPKNLLMGAACFVLAVRSVRAEQEGAWCEGGPWEDLLVIGDSADGTRFCETRYTEGTVVTGIEAWATDGGVEGIQFYYSDGKPSKLYGTIKGDGKRVDWDPSVDSVTQVRSWGNGRGQHLGRIELKTTKGAHLDVGKDTSGQDTFEYNVGSGIMLGAFGSSSSLIESLGFYFLKSKIDKISMDDIVFDETPEMLNERMEGLEIVTLDQARGENTLKSGNYTWEFGKIEERSATKTFSTSSTHEFGYSYALEVSGKILDLGASATHTLSYKYSTSTSEESSQTKKVALSYKSTAVLKPGQVIYCKSTSMMGTFNGDFRCKINIHLEDGSTFSFDKKGTLEQTNWSEADTVCSDDPFPAPSESKKRALKWIA